MIVYPVIQILEGKCVSLERGDLSKPIVWHHDPLNTTKEFAEAGAAWLHVTDLDGISGSTRNEELITDIIRQAGISVQLGGGIRSLAQAEHWIELGAGRIVFGTLAVINPYAVKEMAKLYPDQVVLALDIWQGKVMIQGWQETGAIAPHDFVHAYHNIPLAGIVITDVDSSIDDLESTLEQLTELAQIATSPVIASGVVRTKEDIKRLTGIYNVQGVFVGQALYNRRLSIEDIL